MRAAPVRWPTNGVLPGARRTRKLGRRTRFDAILRYKRPTFLRRRLLNHRRWRRRRSLLLAFSVVLTLLVGRALPRGNLFQSFPLRLHPHVGVARQHGTRNVPAILMITSSPAPDSASSETSVWRLSGRRPFTPAFWRTLIHAVLNDVMGRVGSAGSGDPKANTNHSGMHAPNRRVYQAACASIAAMAVSFSGITRPVPPSVFDLPTVSAPPRRSDGSVDANWRRQYEWPCGSWTASVGTSGEVRCETGRTGGVAR